MTEFPRQSNENSRERKKEFHNKYSKRAQIIRLINSMFDSHHKNYTHTVAAADLTADFQSMYMTPLPTTSKHAEEHVRSQLCHATTTTTATTITYFIPHQEESLAYCGASCHIPKKQVITQVQQHY